MGYDVPAYKMRGIQLGLSYYICVKYGQSNQKNQEHVN
jgi:hypothetical protein